ncbi:MAG TPA: BrnA antitoxin family protein [Desulfobaccales bacterium]|jgi:uncharacterized protein (DUF4415 family)
MKEKNLQKSSRSDWARVDALKDEDIDFSDIPELGEAFFRNADIRLPERKVPVCIRLDREVVDWFKARGKKYQSRINAVLKAFIERQKKETRQGA